MGLFLAEPRNYNKNFFIVGLGITWFSYSHYLVYWKDAVWYADDYLELVVPWFKNLIVNDAIFKDNAFMLPGMLSSLPRGIYPSEFYLETWLYYFLEPYLAIVVNKFLLHTIAYLSAFHFISSLNISIKSYRVTLFSICWATLGFWAGAGIGAAAIPSLFYVFYRLYKGDRFEGAYGVFLLLYAFYSYLHLHGLFLLITIFFFGIIAGITQKKFPWHYFMGFSLLSVFYLLFNYRLIDIYFFQRDWFVPHRLEYDIYSFGAYHDDLVKSTYGLLFWGAFHSAQTSPILFWAAFVLFLSFSFVRSDQYLQYARLAFIGALAFSIVAMALKYLPIVEFFSFLKIFRQFSYERFSNFVSPLLLFSLIVFIEKLNVRRRGKVLGDLLLTVMIAYQVVAIDDNLRNKILKPILGMGEKYATYRAFYAVEQFKEINEVIQEKSPDRAFKVASLGIHPAVAIFNGIPSIDGYVGIYDLDYKHKIFEVIHQELVSYDFYLYRHFVGWGNKCYLFNQHHGDNFLRWKWTERPPISPKYDYAKLQELGCKFLISTNPVVDDSVILIRTFSRPESAWELFLYGLR